MLAKLVTNATIVQLTTAVSQSLRRTEYFCLLRYKSEETETCSVLLNFKTTHVNNINKSDKLGTDFFKDICAPYAEVTRILTTSVLRILAYALKKYSP